MSEDVAQFLGVSDGPARSASETKTESTRHRVLRDIRECTCYRFLRAINGVVFWLNCLLIALASFLGLFYVMSAEVLGFWSFLFLVALTAEAVVVVMVIRGGAEMAIDIADCIAEQTRLATEAQEKPRPEATPSPPPTPPIGS
jgi:hypothetical protein